jgi:hypothetical protein
MRKFVMAITYKPKIEAVRNGKCTQTIRMTDKFKVGDSILLHGWSGKPYRSKWSWRKRVTISRVINALIDIDYGSGKEEKILHLFCPFKMIISFGWDHPEADKLAALDFIDPPTGIELRNVLTKLNKAKGGNIYQIIRW